MTSTRVLLIMTALLETVTGVALLTSPSVPASLLLGASLDSTPGLTVARVAGAALLSLGLACWLARDDGQGQAGRGGGPASLGLSVTGALLWPAVGLHTALAAWCSACLRPVSLSARS